MFWADEIAQRVKERNYDISWVDDMKTPSGKIHVGSLRAVTTHHLVYKAISDLGLKSKFTYVFDNHDPMDGLPGYLDQEKYEKYLGMPLFMIPAPEGDGDFATYYAKEFEQGFRKIGCDPEIIWAKDLYLSGKMNDGIKKVLDNADKIRKIYSELYSKEIPNDWYPFNPYCPNCNKVSTTKVTDWDGEMVTFECKVDGLDWVKGCGYSGKLSPFPTNEKINGKLPWKVEWAVKWQAIGITVEGAGKDHMTAGGSHDLAQRVAGEVLEYPTPFSFAHEFFLIGGKKMSSSRGTGISVSGLLEILPPELVRFLIARTKLNQAINFDPEEIDTIPKLFEEYQEYASHYFTDKKDDYARIFELSQVGEIKKPTNLKFGKLLQLVQSPNGKDEIEKNDADEWVEYARIWIERFAPEKDKFLVQENLPDISSLTSAQKKYLGELSNRLNEGLEAEKIQQIVYDLSKEMEMKAVDAFKAIYISLLGNDHGPKAADLIASLDIEFVKKRFKEIA